MIHFSRVGAVIYTQADDFGGNARRQKLYLAQFKGNSRIVNLPERTALNYPYNTVFEDAVTGLFTRGKTYNLHN
jgi:hypothetical protein